VLLDGPASVFPNVDNTDEKRGNFALDVIVGSIAAQHRRI
jgi:hypothetical protein